MQSVWKIGLAVCAVLSFSTADAVIGQLVKTEGNVQEIAKAKQDLPPLSASIATKKATAAAKGLAYLDAQQSADGSFSGFAGTGPTSLVVSAMQKSGRNENHPVVKKAIGFILKNKRKDGGFYAEKSLYKNYETSLAVVVLSAAGKGKTYKTEVGRAIKFLKKMQWNEEENKEKDDMAYGGAGYGKHGRPDLSNTSHLVDALNAVGTEKDDPNMKMALKFISRCQNHESEHAKTKFAATGTKDGGFFYTAAAGGETKVKGSNAATGLRSYGSMTYAGLKSMLYAGVDKNDSRVQAALTYIRKHYDLNSNPGVGQQGLYYYYHLFAKALSAFGEKDLKDGKGTVHPWREELVEELVKRQSKDGSWVNSGSDRWMEGDRNLVTAYALLALSYCK